METKLTINELATKVVEELKKMNYANNTVCQFRASFNRILSFAKEHNEIYFSEELGRQYLAEKYDCAINYYLQSFPQKCKHALRSVRMLGDYQIHGIIIRRIVKKKNYIKPPQFEQVLTAYEKECQDNEYSIRGMRTRLQRLFFFIDYLHLKNIKDLNEITPNIITDYVKTIYHHHEKSIAAILTTLRMFLRFSYHKKYTEKDLSLIVPKQNKYYYPAVPSTWKPEAVKHMLESIDRGNPLGKRDYAILILVAKLGIRAGDIKAMKLTDLDWKNMAINIIQEKTNVKAKYPILNDIGWALIDYLKNGRPANCESPYLFVRLNAPYEPFGKNANMNNIITKYTRKAGISIPPGNRHGLHSLRHALASTLLAQGTPLPVITEILGHIDSKSTAVYLRTDMDGLKECALNPEEVFDYER
ncbi:tyrosine-type recombinase/integrase [Clostridium sp. PL3]|uniref:Tyrosine-type recombinase/integrase n=1 Tax=Clostridium thailandense TaxID=2794346 RepID=A0A949U3E4_9CLOT|nr:site-specific integrase [Clostridium thailandense]MBV7275713.1 tyrosine-type recombinase/integrase [Clostridium thailandense]